MADQAWLAAVSVMLPEGLPVDDPSLDPIWSAMNEADLPLVHHSFFYEPPYFPGYRDIWGNLAIARMAAHPWGAQRLTAHVILSGMLDPFPVHLVPDLRESLLHEVANGSGEIRYRPLALPAAVRLLRARGRQRPDVLVGHRHADPFDKR